MTEATERKEADAVGGSPLQAVVRVRFTPCAESVPKTIPMIDDQRMFLFIEGGDAFTGYHVQDRQFRDMIGVTRYAEAWAQWEEAAP